jgi:parvulin-like peptidyl-prolyl isomerase
LICHFDFLCDFQSYPGLLDIPQSGIVFPSMARAIIIPIVITCIAASPGLAQKEASLPQDTVARIGPTAITARELIQRVEMMPFPGKQKKDQTDSVKIKALHAMIAEKLLANEAKRLSLPEGKKTALMRRELESAFIRDELYRRKVVARSKPREDEIIKGMTRFMTEFQVLSFLVRTEADGEALYKELQTMRMDTILQHVSRSLYTQVDTIGIAFGAPDESFENAAYAIGRSRVSKPFHSSNLGWAVLYVLDKHSNPEAAKMNLAERQHCVERILQERTEAERGEQYYYEILKSRQAKADERIFNLLADSIVGLWKEDTAHFYWHGAYILTSDMVDLILDRLQPYLDSILVRIDDGDLTLGEVLEMFRYKDFRSRALEGEKFKLELNEAVKNVVAQELLTREGRRQGLQYSSAVQNDVQLWTDYWAAGALYYRVRDSVTVTDEDIVQFLLKHKETFGRYYEVNVREVLTDSLQGVEMILEELQRGRALAALASQHSRRGEWAKNGGESGYFKVLQHPEIGFQAMNVDTGRLVGPLRLPEGYSIFKVLGKRRTQESVVSFDTLKQNVLTRLLTEKRKRTVHQYMATLAREQNVSVDYDRLKRVRITQIPMFTRRLIGFGGRMAAFPLLMQRWDWIKEYLQPSGVLP